MEEGEGNDCEREKRWGRGPEEKVEGRGGERWKKTVGKGKEEREKDQM